MHRTIYPRIRAAISMLGLCALPGSAASASVHSSFGSHFGSHGSFGGRPHGGTSWFIGGRPNHYYGGGYWGGGWGGRSRFSLGLNFFFGSPYYSDPFWYDPVYYYPPYPRTRVVIVHDDDYYLYRRDDSRYDRYRDDRYRDDRYRDERYRDDRYRDDRYRDDRDRRDDLDDTDDYYLYRRRPSSARPPIAASDAGLKEAIEDIQTAFQVGDVTRLEKHVTKSGKIVLTTNSTTRRDIGVDDYLQMTRDAIKDMKTRTYELSKVEPASNGAWLVTGRHTILQDDKLIGYNVSFVLKRDGDHWFIAEVGADRVDLK